MSVLEDSINKYNESAAIWNLAKMAFDDLYRLDFSLLESLAGAARKLLLLQVQIQELGVQVTDGSQQLKPERLLTLPDRELLASLFFPLVVQDIVQHA